MQQQSTKKKISIVSWNTCGIRETADFPNKFKDITKELEKLECGIAFLQETHIGPKGIDIIKDVRDWHSYFTVHHPRSKGVAILIKKSLNYTYEFHDEDFGGSYIVLVCQLEGKHFTLVNVYNHAKDKTVLQRLTEYLHEFAKGILVIGGDFNAILHYDFDRKCPTGHLEPLRPYLEQFISSLNLVDVWGQTHPMKRKFTYFKEIKQGEHVSSGDRTIVETSPQKKHKQSETASRLDMFFMPCDTIQYVENCSIRQVDISDHNPVLLEINIQSLTDVRKPSLTTCTSVRPITQAVTQQRDSGKVPGEISGAEVLAAIKSLIVCKGIIDKYQFGGRNKRATVTNNLKLLFNDMIRDPEHSSTVRHGSIEYLILTTILARRLEVFLRSSFKSRFHKFEFDSFVLVSFCTIPEKINGPFLDEAIKVLKRIHPAPPRNFSILKTLLPSHKKSIRLLPNSPLTSAILTLSLKWLANNLKSKLEECEVDVCRHRRCMVVYMHSKDDEILSEEQSKFEKMSEMQLQKKCNRVHF